MNPAFLSLILKPQNNAIMKYPIIKSLLFLAIASFSSCSFSQNKPPVDGPVVKIMTKYGDMKVVLYNETPLHRDNFMKLTKEGVFDSLLFHRVIKGFMIQGGGLNEEMEQKKPKFAIKNEATNGISNKRGTLAMARSAMVDSATSQFFINVVDNPFLDHRGKQMADFGYCVFGQVLDGMEVVDEIRAVKTGNNKGHSDVPVESVFIKSARLIEQEAA